MKALFIVVLAMTAACSADADANEASGAVTNRTAATVEAPAGGLEPQTPETILGAIDGPCGSTKVDEFLGEKWSEEIARAMQGKSGASEVKPFRFNDSYDPATKFDERRLNVYLSPSGRIVHLVCG
jgi:hypothetical protein